ncbi:hypothetical protein I4U23_021134 [Adineta vaga]|nr:hypothetical protein I4U23_021134 [Adineta vaga]
MTSPLTNNSIKPIRKRRFNSPNEHIMVLVQEWYNDAKANGAQTMRCYTKALRSLEKYPLRLETGSDCRILYGFGEKICEAIDQRLNTKNKPTIPTKMLYKTVSMSNFDEKKDSIPITHLSDHGDDDKIVPPPAKQPKMTNKTIKKTNSAGAKLFTNPGNSTTQVTTISTLLGIIDSPMKTTLTPPKSVQILKPGSFHITLCVDNAEASRSTQKVLLDHLTKNSINYDVRKLNIGDFLWIVRPNDKTFKVEAILDYIVERKRLDDLSKSIIDGRYNEQKFRLKQCGITNLIYLVESLKNTNNPGILTPAALNQAIVNTQIAEDFFVREVSNPVEMANYLITMTKYLINHFKDKTLHILNDTDMSNNYKTSFNDLDHYVMMFDSFNSGVVKSKPPTVKEMFARALMQIAGMSVDNVLALTEVYPTPAKLLQAYQQCSNDKERKLMLSSIKKITSNRKLGKIMQEANRNTDLILQAQQILKDADLRGIQTLDVIGESSVTISKTIDKYILNEHLINTSRDLINQYERKAKYEKLIIVSLLVIFFAAALNIMGDDNMNDTSSPSSHPFFVHGGFPFVFLPTTLAGGFNYTNHHTHTSLVDDRSTYESEKRAENVENNEEDGDDDEEERTETIDDDEGDRKDENDESADEKSNLRISQPKYSQLLKELDFSQARMVDVTNLLPNELDQTDSQSINDDNDNDNDNENKRQTTDDEKYQTSEDEPSNAPTIDNNHETDDNKTKADNQLIDAVHDIENDLNNLATIIHAASTDKNKDEENDDEEDKYDSQKKPTFDEEDDTSKQATQDYDLHDNDQEQPFRKQPLNEVASSGPAIESHSTPKKASQQQQQQQPKPADSSDEKQKPRTSSYTKQKPVHRSRQRISPSNSSSDTDSIVEYALHRSKDKHSSSFQNKQHKPLFIPPQTLRQDSQATLIDENLDELNSQLRHVLHDQELYTLNGSTKDERTSDGTGTMPFPLSTPDILSTTILDDELMNRRNDNLFQHISNPRQNYNQQRNRHSAYVPERSSSHKKKSHHHQQKYSTSRHPDQAKEINERNPDDDWLTMLEKLEREHQERIEQQRKQYEDYMHTLEGKMKRSYDDYVTITNGSKDSRSDDYDNIAHEHRAQKSVPIDSNLGKYNGHSYNHTYRPIATDLISHYYPADSTLNVLSSDKKRATIIDHISSSQPRDDLLNLRTDPSSRRTKQYEYEMNDFRSQLNRQNLGSYSSGAVRRSMGTIERLNSDNIRLRDELNGVRHSLKVSDDENVVLKRQLDELREQINHKDLDLKNYHRTISDFERKLNDSENTKERHNEKFRHVERQASLYRDENEKLKVDLNRTRERVLRLEERSREQENENDKLRRQLFLLESDTNRIKNRMTDDHKLNTTIPVSISSPRDYQPFTMTSITKHSPSPISTPRDGIIDSGKYQSNGSLYRSTHSPRPLTRITDYLTEKTLPSHLHVSPSRHVYPAKKSSPTRRRTESVPRRDSFERQTKQPEHLEQKFDHLLKKKRDLEARLHRIPARGLTTTDHQLYDVLEREIERVDQQIMSVKLDLRRSNTLRTY